MQINWVTFICTVKVDLFVGTIFRGFFKMDRSRSSWIRGFKHYRQQSLGKLYFVGFLFSWFTNYISKNDNHMINNDFTVHFISNCILALPSIIFRGHLGLLNSLTYIHIPVYILYTASNGITFYKSLICC